MAKRAPPRGRAEVVARPSIARRTVDVQTGRSRQWLGAVAAARVWATCQSLPPTLIVPPRYRGSADSGEVHLIFMPGPGRSNRGHRYSPRRRHRAPTSRHDNWTRFARVPEHGAVTHRRPGLPSCMSRVRTPSPAPTPVVLGTTRSRVEVIECAALGLRNGSTRHAAVPARIGWDALRFRKISSPNMQS
jgi:hypothetical protein